MYRILYSNCWEDAEVVNKALNIKPGGSYLSIASAGDNSLSILSCGPDLVLAVDKNPAQLACLELRTAAISNLSYPDTLAFMGLTPSIDRITVYREIRNSLSPYAQRFWDQHLNDIAHGIIHAGQTEKNFRCFRKYVLPLIISRSDQKKLLQKMPMSERAQLCEKVFSRPRYHYIMRSLFSRAVITQIRVGTYSTFHALGNGHLARIVMERVRKGFNTPHAHNNPYITYIMTGNFGDTLPFYLRKEVFLRIKENIGSLKIFSGTICRALASYRVHKFCGFNLSDIFEYMNTSDFHSCIHRLADNAQPGARLVYWNTLKKRDVAYNAPEHVRACTDYAQELSSINKSFFYDSIKVDEVA